MQCPVCDHEAPVAAFGDPLRCPECGAFYEKALLIKAGRQVQTPPPLRAAAPRPPVRKKQTSPFMIVVACLIGFVVLLAVIGSGNKPEQPSRAAAKPVSEYDIIRAGQRAVENKLKDSDSAKFSSQFVGKSGVPCGSVNAKNSFGGYTGYMRYMASGGGIVIIEGEVDQDTFEGAWDRVCAR